MSRAAERTDPELWEQVKKEVTRSSKGGRPGQWSARKAQVAVQVYRQRGGRYRDTTTSEHEDLQRAQGEEGHEIDREG